MESATHNPRVPYDLLHPIFEQLEDDKASLCAISLASSVFRDEAQRILFRKVTTLQSYTSHLMFLRTVAASPTRLDLLVHAYSHFWWRGGPTSDELIKSLPNEVENGLKAMRCLKELTISVARSSFSSHPAYIHILSECAFRLERFEWEGLQIYADDLVDNFLIHQPSLRYLKLPYIAPFTDERRVVPSTTCPHLVSLTASWSMIKAFLPGRNISTLCSTDCIKDSVDTNNKSLAAELKHVEFLSIPGFWRMKQSGLEALRCLSSVNSLEIYGPGFYDEHEGMLVSLKMPELVTILSELLTLQTLILSIPFQERTQQDAIELTHHVFAKFGEHLSRIYICEEGYLYSQYIHSQETVQKIRKEEVIPLWL